MIQKKILSLIILCYCVTSAAFCQLRSLDQVIFGNETSEQKHNLQSDNSKIISGGLGESARQLLPIEGSRVEGGSITFEMKVDPIKQNYVTVRFWGSDIGKGNYLILFCEGKQMGYRHLGDYDVLDISNDEPPLNDRFYYVTSPVPLQMTRGKEKVQLAIRSTGPIWGYGNTFDSYQKAMIVPSKGIYGAYIHSDPCFVPDKKEKQGKAVIADAPVRMSPGAEVLDNLKEILSARINQIVNKSTSLGQQEIWLLADAYSVAWTPAYQSPIVVEKVMRGIDDHYQKYVNNPIIIHTDGSVYNGDWMTTCMLARSIRALWNRMQNKMDVEIEDVTTRREAWSRLMEASIEYGITHRRQYTNQSMIIDLAIYECNRALMLMNPDKALPEYQTLRYLYESLALAPWFGKETKQGPEKPLGDNYWQLTDKGLTKELGFVGYYGEVVDWAIHIYKATALPGIPDSGDFKIREQLLRIANARYHFRYPAVDNEGYRCFRAEAVVGWRDGGHYPGNVIYGDRGSAWDATPLMTAASTLDPYAVGIAQQMLEDNQFFAMVADKLKDSGNIRSLQSCLHIPDQYELIKLQPASDKMLPMSSTAPDYVFADEEDGVVAIKNGDDILYTSLYWRARNAVNNLCKVHYITPTMERLANVCIETKFQDSGLRYTRPDWVNLGFSSAREWYQGVHSAHVGEVLPIAKIPEGISFKVGDENAYAGRADYYRLDFGKYIIVMNSSKDKVFEFSLPQNKNLIVLTDGKRKTNEEVMKIPPHTTVVLYMK